MVNMSLITKVKSYLIQYLKYKNIDLQKRGSILMFKCPFCNTEPDSVSLQVNSDFAKCHAPDCIGTFDIFDCCRFLDNMQEQEPDDIIEHIKTVLELDIQTTKEKEKIDKVLSFYEENGFSLVQITANQKNPPLENEWQKKTHYNKKEWKGWIENGLNVGVRGGEASNLIVIDVDFKPVPEELRDLLGDTLAEESRGGFHYFYKYTPEFKKCAVWWNEEEKKHIDIQTTGSYTVIFPSVVEGQVRSFTNEKTIKEMPEKLLEKLKSLPAKKSKLKQKEQPKPVYDINNISLETVDDGSRTNTLMSLGGLFSKELNIPQTTFVLQNLNKIICNPPLSYREIRKMVESVHKYRDYDNDDLSHSILDYLKHAETATKMDIGNVVFSKIATGEPKKILDKTLVDLQRAGKIIKRGKEYHIKKSMDWQDTITNIGVPVNFKVPYFDEYAHFNIGDLVIVGGKTGVGKTSLAMNIIKRFVDQGIKPYYVYNESGGRFSKTSLRLGLKDKDFYNAFSSDPEKLIMEPNSVILYDWVKPPNFARTDNLFDGFVSQLQATNSFMICFVQLRDSNEFFAKDQLDQFAAFACKYIQEEDNRCQSAFHIKKIRDPKMNLNTYQIPCKYFWDSKLVKKIEELNAHELSQ